MKKLLAVIFALFMCVCIIPVSADEITVSASAAAVINGDNGEVIYLKNADERLPMASTTKIMTALLLCEHGDFNREITVTKEMLAVEGSSMGLLPGDTVTLHDLLYGMLLASGNDAANVTAFVLGGSMKGFVDMMNEKAQVLGLQNTHFATPSGLDADDHYTTALELANLARYAMQNDDFAAAASSKSAVLNYGNPPYRRTLTNHNRLLKYFDGAVGVKTGFTKKSGRCLVSAAKRDGKYVIAVTLHDPNDWSDHEQMLEYGFSVIQQIQCSPEKAEYIIPVIGGSKDSLTVKTQPYTVNSVKTAEITCKTELPKFLYAPIKKGDAIGKISYFSDGEKIAVSELVAEENIGKAPTGRNYIYRWLKNAADIIGNFH